MSSSQANSTIARNEPSSRRSCQRPRRRNTLPSPTASEAEVTQTRSLDDSSPQPPAAPSMVNISANVNNAQCEPLFFDGLGIVIHSIMVGSAAFFTANDSGVVKVHNGLAINVNIHLPGLPIVRVSHSLTRPKLTIHCNISGHYRPHSI